MWNGKFFKALGDSWGTFVKVDQDTASMNRFDVARLLVIVDSKVKIPSIVSVKIGESSYKIVVSLEQDLTSDESLFIVSKDSDRQSSGNTGCMEMESHCMRSDTAMHSGVDDYSWMLLEKCDMVEFSSRLSENEIMGMCDSTTNLLAVVNSLSTFVEDSLADRAEPISNGGFRSGSPRWGTGYESSPIDSYGLHLGVSLEGLNYEMRVHEARKRARRPRRNLNKLMHNEPESSSDSSISDSAIANRNRLIFAEGEANTEMSAALGFRYARNIMQLVEVFSILEESAGDVC
ncbi:hypothetical protein PTKIN_Ptkin06aG0055200 [Pterospermum kingtungense]